MGLPRQTKRAEVVRKFRALGWAGPVPGGHHAFMVRGKHKVRIPNPHGTDDIRVSLLTEILRQAGISRDDWLRA